MKSRAWKMEVGGGPARSVLECGSPLLLSSLPADRTRSPSASRRRAEAALWRAAKAEGLAQSKTWRSLAASLVFLAVAITARAQSYSIDWFTIDGGGGTSTGGVYTISGTVGQPDAGTLTGVAYSLIGGFWSVLAAPTSAPLVLRLVRGEGMVILSWPNPSIGFQLQETPSLLGPMTLWTDVDQAPSVVSGEKQVILSLTPGDRFFRLRKL